MPTSSRCGCVVVVTFRADVGIRPYMVGAWRCLAFLLVVGAVGVVRRRWLAVLLVCCTARVDVGIDPYMVGALVVWLCFLRWNYFSTLNW